MPNQDDVLYFYLYQNPSFQIIAFLFKFSISLQIQKK